MSIAVASPAATTALAVERKLLLAALEKAQAVLPGRCCKPILSGVRLEATGGLLHLAATDGEITLTTQLVAEGHLPACVVPCTELIRRLRASKETLTSVAVRTRPQRLMINGGRVEHALHTLTIDDFPPVPDRWQGQQVVIAAEELHHALAMASCAMARDASRYAITGVLLESDTTGIRLVATDGRRLVLAELSPASTSYQGRAILPARLVKLVQKLTAGQGARSSARSRLTR